MRIALITPTPRDCFAFGLRVISAFLKQHGHTVKMIFLPGGIDQLEFEKSSSYGYSPRVLQKLKTLCADDELIGISFMTHYYERAIQITEALKPLGRPIVWGGTHPTVAPEESLAHVEIVCVGEGEDALLELVNRMAAGEEYTGTANFFFRRNDTVIRNSPRRLRQDLDSLPPMDYDLAQHYVLDPHRDDIVPIDRELLSRILPRMPYFHDRLLSTYRTMVNRGCPHNCTYCTSPVLKRLYEGQSYLRHRSIGHVMEELRGMIARYPFIESVFFFDDTFFALPLSYITEFSQRYKQEIGLPMYVQGSPRTITREKYDALIEAGCVNAEMGIQTGSARTQTLYERKVSNEDVLRTAAMIHSYGRRLLPAEYHIILDNPWETRDDILATLRLLLQLPRPFSLCISSLIFFPKTELARKALAEGFFHGDLLSIARNPFLSVRPTYLNYLICLTGYNWVPRWWIRLLAAPPLVRLFHRDRPSRVIVLLSRWTDHLILLGKGLRSVCRGDFARIRKYFDKVKLLRKECLAR